MSEKGLEKRVCECIKRQGGRVYKFVSPGRTGVPDRVAVFPGGRVVFIELKSATGKLSVKQMKEIVRLRGLGAEVWVIKEEDGVPKTYDKTV